MYSKAEKWFYALQMLIQKKNENLYVVHSSYKEICKTTFKYSWILKSK